MAKIRLKSVAIPAMVLPLLMWSCSEKKSIDEAPTDTEFHGLHVHHMDTSVAPGEDFFHYANGAWLAETEIPPAEGRWGTFNELEKRNNKILRAILEKAAAMENAEKGSSMQLLGDFFSTAMDSTKAEELGKKPLEPLLQKIDEIASIEDLIKQIAWNHRHRIGGGFSMWVRADAKNSKMNIVNVGQGGLSLPDRDYYLGEGEDMQEIRTKYSAHIDEMFDLIGNNPEENKGHSSTILGLETELAEASMDRVSRRNPDNTYHKKTLAELEELCPNVPWKLYFESLGLSDPGSMNVAQPEFFKALSNAMDKNRIEDWKVYLKWKTISAMAPHLSSDFVDASFNFFSKTLEGREEKQPRTKRAIQQISWNLGFALGEEFVKESFSPTAKEKALNMVDNILEVMKDRLSNLEWLSDSTRQQAVHKLSTITPKIGYPDEWRDYSSMKLSRDNHVDNVLAAAEYGFNFSLAKANKPVDPKEWGIPPQIVNAYYNPSRNEIVFPAGILQRPFFDEKVDEALNYGGFGAVIGHELIHAFDDSGSKYDADGNLRKWWTDDDRKNFEKRAQVVVEQYNGYNPIDSMNINGKLTLGENIADIEGLRMSYLAFQRSLNGETPQLIDGFNAEQRFFINYGNIWASSYRPEMLKLRLKTDPHSPPQYRVIGSLSNRPEFYAAFGVKNGDAMYRPDSIRVSIW